MFYYILATYVALLLVSLTIWKALGGSLREYFAWWWWYDKETALGVWRLARSVYRKVGRR